eukprot:TRINITY_DN1034_c0_g1_i5.p1 TRINITY_DN1034_c0_g1~~TRINITY_DN1034_c0_g1_i5.p1  ORF type:complete len:244 (-),score=33.94 TRINITY_DN1034_c0_g1_i5:160-891(-)
MKIPQILNIFECLLVENRIIVVAKEISVLSHCVNALYAMTYPFVWQHVFIPILPKKLMEYCTAPMPFLIGIPASSLSDLLKLPLEEVLIVDLDNGKFIREPDEMNEVLPPSLKSRLLKNFTKFKNLKDRSEFDKQVATQFLQFFAEVFYEYQKFINPEDHKFSFDKHVAAPELSADYKKFLNAFSASQMFSVWKRSREQLSRDGMLDQCILIKTPVKPGIHRKLGRKIRRISSHLKIDKDENV